jgi:hypothetical protein
MRKNLVSAGRDTDAASSHDWLKLERVARVEVSSEAEGYPVEGALLNDGQRAWQANKARYSDHSATVRSPADNSSGSGSVQRRRICFQTAYRFLDSPEWMK